MAITSASQDATPGPALVETTQLLAAIDPLAYDLIQSAQEAVGRAQLQYEAYISGVVRQLGIQGGVHMLGLRQTTEGPAILLEVTAPVRAPAPAPGGAPNDVAGQ